MCPSKLLEWNGAALLRERVRQAVQVTPGVPIAKALKDAVAFGDHDLQITTVDNPATLKVTCGVRCRTCGWCFRTVVSFPVGTKPASDKGVLEATFYQLLRRFCQEVDEDCKTASLMTVVTGIHDL